MFQSCWLNTGEDDENMVEPFPISSYNPVIVKRQVLETSTILQEPQTIVNSGKIYVKDDFLFINEKNQGFHIFNNSNPANPTNIGFLKVLGSSDLAIKNDIIYVNNATDLIAIQPKIPCKINTKIICARNFPIMDRSSDSSDAFFRRDPAHVGHAHEGNILGSGRSTLRPATRSRFAGTDLGSGARPEPQDIS